MTTGQKISVSLLCAVCATCLFAIAAYSQLFSFIELRFYQPAVMQGVENRVEKISVQLDKYIETVTERFQSFLASPAVISVFAREQTASDIASREQLVQALLSETDGFRGVRIVSEDGRRIHFSSFKSDIRTSSGTSVVYKNYGELDATFFGLVAVRRGGSMRVIADTKRDYLIFAFPVYDTMEAFRGTALFILDARGFFRFAVRQGLISIAEHYVLVSVPQKDGHGVSFGFLFGVPVLNNESFVSAAVERWRQHIFYSERIGVSQESVWMLFSSASDWGCIGWLHPESLFLIPAGLRFVCVLSVFITLFLLFFLISTLRRDKLLVIRDHIKRFEVSFIADCVSQKEAADWQSVCGELKARRCEVISTLRKSFGRLTAEQSKIADELLDKSFEEILRVLSAHEQVQIPADKLQKLVEKIISEEPENTVRSPADIEMEPYIEELDEFEAVDDDEELEELEAVDDDEELEELEAVDDTEEPKAVTEQASNNGSSQDLTEELCFGDPVSYVSHSSADTLEDFTASAPDYSSADKKSAEAEPVSNGGISLFYGFSNGDIGYKLLVELPFIERLCRIRKTHADAIVEHDGIFSIAQNIDYSVVEQDPLFKQLVDSVL